MSLKLSLKAGVKLLNAIVALKSRHSLLWYQMHGGLLFLTCMPYVASLQAYFTLLYTSALSFPEYSYILLLLPATNCHICIVIILVTLVSVGLPQGPQWPLVVPSGC